MHPISMDIATIYNISEEAVSEAKKRTAPFFSLLQKGLITDKDFLEEVSKALNKASPKNCTEIAEKLYSESFAFYPEMMNFVEELKSKKIKTAVLSNIPEFQADIIRKNNGYKGFDVVVLSYKEKLEKPELDIYISTLKKLKLKPDECIFIDDKQANLLPAISLGMKTVLAVNPKQIANDVYSIIESENEKSI